MGMRSRKKAIKRSTCPFFGLRGRTYGWTDGGEAPLIAGRGARRLGLITTRGARDMLALPSYFRNSKRFNFSGFLIVVNAQDVVESVSDSK